jgi:sugar lactone lactonase YvrE
MNEVVLIDTIKVANTLGECILWDEQSQSTWWTDIHESRLYRYTLTNKQLQVYALPGRLCSFGFMEDDSRLICAFAEGFALYDPETGKREWLYQPEANYTGTRFNDGRVDRQGRFWSGTMVEDEVGYDTQGNPVKGSLYWLAGQAHGKTLTAIQTSNSLCWSIDGKTMFFADSRTKEIRAYDFEPDGALMSNESVFVRTEPSCSPDGSIIDAEGCLWNAHWGGSKVVRFSPQGEVMTEIDLPVSQPTCVCFGGPDLDLLFVSTAREKLDTETLTPQPQAGDVFVFRTPYRGLPENRYRPNQQ